MAGIVKEKQIDRWQWGPDQNKIQGGVLWKSHVKRDLNDEQMRAKQKDKFQSNGIGQKKMPQQ